MAKTDLTAQRLRELLDYNPDTGIFTWRITPKGGRKAGEQAGCNSHGYRVIRLDNRLYPAHRLAWLYVHGRWPTHQVDHIDMNRSNNAIHNLREASKSENMQNRIGPVKSSASGILGVYWHPGANRWESRICINHKKMYLGLFDTAEQAHQAYLKAKRELHPFSML